MKKFLLIVVLLFSVNAMAEESILAQTVNQHGASTPIAASAPVAQAPAPTLVEKVAILKEGGSTYDEAVSLLGTPANAANNADGTKSIVYNEDRTKKVDTGSTAGTATAHLGAGIVAAFVPFGGLFLAGATAAQSSSQPAAQAGLHAQVFLIFDKTGKLSRKSVQQY